MRTKTSRNHGIYANHGAHSAPYLLALQAFNTVLKKTFPV